MGEPNTERNFTVARSDIERIVDEFEKLVCGEVAHDPENTALKDIDAELTRVRKTWSENCFQVAVLALAKSGKSTLINALLGGEYLPSSNTPETARIVRIRHESTVDKPTTLKQAGTEIAVGIGRIRAELKSLNASQRKSDSATVEDDLVLSAPFACLANRSLGRQRFEILDTPGPNEAGADSMRAQVDTLLSDADVIIYLLDYTKLKTDEERDLFARLASMRPELLKQWRERLFFVVNKIDLRNRSGLSQDETREYVATLLSKQLNGLTVPPERVLPVSSEEGLLARVVASGDADGGVYGDFARRVFGELGKGSTHEECRLAAPKLLTASKLIDLEDSIISFIYRNRGRILLQSIVERLHNACMKLDNGLRIQLKLLRQDLKGTQQHYDDLKDKFETTAKEFDDIESVAARVVGEIEQWMRKRFSNFHDNVERKLKHDDRKTSPRWSRVKEAFGRLGRWESDKAKVERKLKDVNTRIEASLREEFDIFYDDLRREAWEHQKRLFEEIEDKLKPLIRHTETVMGKTLSIPLNPVSVKIQPPSLDEFMYHIQKRLRYVIERREREEEYQTTEPILIPGSWCGEDEYVDQPVIKTRRTQSHKVGGKDVIESWIKLIKDMTDTSSKTALNFIKPEVQKVVRMARSKLRDQRDGYVETMHRALQDSQQDQATREARLTAVQTAREELLGLKDGIQKCNEFLEPQA